VPLQFWDLAFHFNTKRKFVLPQRSQHDVTLPSVKTPLFCSPRWKEIYVHYRLFLSDDVNFVAFLAFACSSAATSFSPSFGGCSHVLVTVAYQLKEYLPRWGRKRERGARTGRRWVQLALLINVVHCGAWCLCCCWWHCMVSIWFVARTPWQHCCQRKRQSGTRAQEPSRTNVEFGLRSNEKYRGLWYFCDYSAHADQYHVGCKCRHKNAWISGSARVRGSKFGMPLYCSLLSSGLPAGLDSSAQFKIPLKYLRFNFHICYILKTFN